MIDPKVRNYSDQLKNLGIQHEIIQHEELNKSPEETLRILGYPLSAGMSTLLLKADDQFITLGRRDDCHLDFNRLAKEIGAKKVRIASPEEFTRETNLPLGAARVYQPNFKQYIDKKSLEKECVLGGTGSFAITFRYKTSDLLKIPGMKVVDATSVLPGEFREIKLFITQEVKDTYPGLDEIVMLVFGVNVTQDEIITSERIKPLVANTYQKDFFDHPKFIAFRKFCNEVGIQTQRENPSVENLYRHFQETQKFPRINNVVDACNLVALETFVPLGVFDSDQIKGDMIMRFSRDGEEFHPLSGGIEYLPGNQIVIADEEKILNHFPFQDSIYPNITKKTKNVVILGDIVSGFDPKETEVAVAKTGKLIEKYAGGKVGKLSYSVTAEPQELTISVENLNQDSKVVKKRRVFSGTRPTGRLHLGNYLGAVKGYLELQNREDLERVYCVVDLHGITTPYNPKVYQEGIRDVVLDYLAAGLDPDKSNIIIQSHLRNEHLELAYYLGTIYPVSRLEDLPTYKEKKLQHPDYVNMGLLYYPVLMAADILIYKADLVPVGVDQEPHIEVTREIARKFNSMFGQTFPEPKRFATRTAKVPSLLGEGKMSKSVEGSYINLTDDLATIREKLARTPTDSGKGDRVPEVGSVANLIAFVDIFEGKARAEELKREYTSSGIRYKELKDELAEAIYKELKPIQEKRKHFESHPEIVKGILDRGAAGARTMASETLSEVRLKMGLD